MNINFQEPNQTNQLILYNYQECYIFQDFLNNLKKKVKRKSDDIDNESSKYIKLNKIELSYMMIREFKDNLTVLKEIEELEIIRELEIEQIK